MGSKKKASPRRGGGATNRRRGHGFEREVAQMLRKLFPHAERQLEYQESECKGVDLKNTGNLRIQCKRAKKSVAMSKLYEIQVSEGIHCLFSKVDRGETLVTLRADDFMAILEDIGVVYDGIME